MPFIKKRKWDDIQGRVQKLENECYELYINTENIKMYLGNEYLQNTRKNEKYAQEIIMS